MTAIYGPARPRHAKLRANGSSGRDGRYSRALLFAYDLVQATGTVARARIQDGKRGELDVRW